MCCIVIHFYSNCLIRLTSLKSKVVNVFRKFMTYNLSAEEGIHSLSIQSLASSGANIRNKIH